MVQILLTFRIIRAPSLKYIGPISWRWISETWILNIHHRSCWRQTSWSPPLLSLLNLLFHRNQRSWGVVLTCRTNSDGTSHSNLKVSPSFDDTDQSFLENFITLATSNAISAHDSCTLFFYILCVSSSCAYTLNANILQRYPRPTAQLIPLFPQGLLQTLTCRLFSCINSKHNYPVIHYVWLSTSIFNITEQN